MSLNNENARNRHIINNPGSYL